MIRRYDYVSKLRRLLCGCTVLDTALRVLPLRLSVCLSVRPSVCLVHDPCTNFNAQKKHCRRLFPLGTVMGN